MTRSKLVRKDVSSPEGLDRYQYGYDQNSDRLYKANVVGTAVVAGGLDEHYTCENLNRLTKMQRGTLTGGPPFTGISGTSSREMDYTLDPTGNWINYLTKTAGTACVCAWLSWMQKSLQRLNSAIIMSVVLIGYRGSGKTTLGRRLAGELGWPFLDLDELIAQQTGMSIAEIFARDGEPGFRRLETLALSDAMKRDGHVISLGGGAVLAPVNRVAIASAGHRVVYLRADATELHRRIQDDPATTTQRPALTRLGGSVNEVRELLAQREPIYQQLKNFELDVSLAGVDELVRQLLAIAGEIPG